MSSALTPATAQETIALKGINGADEALLNSMLGNYRLTPATLAKKIDPSWIAAPHLLYISMKIAVALNKGNARLIISVPPRHGKSRISSIGTSVWALEKWPEKNIILTS